MLVKLDTLIPKFMMCMILQLFKGEQLSGEAPILVIGWNRPEFLKQVLSVAVQECPTRRVYVSIDGPRAIDVAGWEQCVEYVENLKEVFPIELYIHGHNLGPRMGPVTGIDWFFQQEERGIILEDDCRPHPEFFLFCDVLLARYTSDRTIGGISGFRPAPDKRQGQVSYSFAKSFGIWGWATWRDRWVEYSVDMSLWPTLDKRLKRRLHPSNVGGSREYWTSTFQNVVDGKIATWDYQWNFACLVNNWRTCIPSINLVDNLDLFRHLQNQYLWPDDSPWRRLLASRSGPREPILSLVQIDESDYLDQWSDRYLREVERFRFTRRLSAYARRKVNSAVDHLA